MTIIMFALCPTNVIMGMRVTGYLISGKLGNYHVTKVTPKAPLIESNASARVRPLPRNGEGAGPMRRGRPYSASSA